LSEDNKNGRSFSDEKHASGAWRTTTIATANPLIRSLLRYCSFKRSGVDDLAKTVRIASPKSLVIDLGSGQGAYAHWFLSRNANAAIIALDFSREALSRMPSPRQGTIFKLCADADALPIKSESIDALFSCDALGHVKSIAGTLDEILRIVKPGAPLFLHSECGDYRNRWPDSMLIKRIGYDFLAQYDGHQSILPSATLRSLYTQRFRVESIFSAAGLTGWLTGYPEKYRLAFAKAGMPVLAMLTGFFAIMKKMPVVGVMLRIKNATINHLELALGIQGGGSCCARMRKPGP